MFGNYVNSEAEQLYTSWKHRLITGQFLNDCAGESIYTPPQVQLNLFKILDPSLAQQVGCKVNHIFTQSDIQTHPHNGLLVEALGDANKIGIEEGPFNPEFHSKLVTFKENQYIAHLRELLKEKMHAVSSERLRNQEFLSVNSDVRDKAQFKLLMEAIKNNNELQFLEQMLRLATSFDLNHSQAKVAFVEAMTHLFVTKQFSSDGVRKTYLHFILRCGLMY